MLSKIPLVWRTAIVVLLLAVALLVALGLCLRWGGTSGPDYFAHACTAIVGLAFVVTGKSAVEHLAGGGGILGAAKALVTAAKPEGTP